MCTPPCLRVSRLGLGLGPGLTPSGDDFIGGVLFALHHAEDGLSRACTA